MNADDRRGGNGREAQYASTDLGRGERSYEPPTRRQEILRADPYYPHTAWRAVVAWLAYFFIFLGFAALVLLMVPDREFGWYYVATSAAFAALSTTTQFLCRKARVRMLETTGMISEERTGLGSEARA